MLLTLEWENWWSSSLLSFTRPINTVFGTRTMQSNTWEEHIGMTRLLVQHLLYHSKGEMLRWEQSKGHGKGTRAWQKTYKLVRLNLFYEVKEYYWKTSFNKSQAIKKPYNLLPKKCWVVSRTWNDRVLFCIVGFTHNHMFGLGHGFSSIKNSSYTQQKGTAKEQGHGRKSHKRL